LLAVGAIAAAAVIGSAQPTITPTLPGHIVGSDWLHVVQPGESWIGLGARFGVPPATLARRNGRNPASVLRPGDEVVIDNHHIAFNAMDDGLVINVPQRLLFHYQDGTLRRHFPVAVGKASWRTPLGAFTVVSAEENPTWDVPPSIQEEMRRSGKPVLKSVAPGPDNPLGRYWLGLSLGAIGVHGTNVPSSIYSFGTHGCIRLHADDVQELFPHVPTGTAGVVVYEPVLIAVIEDAVYLEAHPDVYHRMPNRLGRALEIIERAGIRDRIDPKRVERVVSDAEGLAVSLTPDRTTRH
jgi:L,D-transpeptidase ErfK/SrfK